MIKKHYLFYKYQLFLILDLLIVNLINMKFRKLKKIFIMTMLAFQINNVLNFIL